MEVLSLLEELEEIIENARGVFGSKVSVDRGKIQELITDIRIGLPDDLKQAEWISNERQRIIFDAQEEADKIISDAKLEAEKIVESDSITQMAYKKAEGIVEDAEEDARELRNGAIHYSQEILKKIARDMNHISEKVMANHSELGKMIAEKDEFEKDLEA